MSINHCSLWAVDYLYLVVLGRVLDGGLEVARSTRLRAVRLFLLRRITYTAIRAPKMFSFSKYVRPCVQRQNRREGRWPRTTLSDNTWWLREAAHASEGLVVLTQSDRAGIDGVRWIYLACRLRH
jgi:hypothetical protein